ncbi:YdcF family protein [Leptolyngbya sp. AN02str]|uniref:YdcF family protein n=1 Tax=Leptolyngbya sp. AN02str TaxID=3423363 RepID=UPI003D310E1B
MNIGFFYHWITLTASLTCFNDQITYRWIWWTTRGMDWADRAMNSPLMYSVGAALVMLVLLRRSLRRNRRVAMLLLIGGFSIVLLRSPLFVPIGNQLMVQALPPDRGQSVDAIVVLGRGLELRPQRVAAALALWQNQRAPRIFASGRGDGAEITAALQQQGIPANALAEESCSRTTEENAEFTAAVLKPKGVQSILLVTDPTHIMRSFLTFRSFGFQVVPYVSAVPEHMSVNYQRRMVVRETLSLVGYGLLGRYFPRGDRMLARLNAIAGDDPSRLATTHQVE